MQDLPPFYSAWDLLDYVPIVGSTTGLYNAYQKCSR